VRNENEISELGVHHGRVRSRRLSDGKVIEVEGGQYAVVSPRTMGYHFGDVHRRWIFGFE
jgi:hypothetical protein